MLNWIDLYVKMPQNHDSAIYTCFEKILNCQIEENENSRKIEKLQFRILE